MSDYKYAGNGTYQKVSDGSSPYGKDENGDFYLIGKSSGGGSGGGGHVDVLGTEINSFNLNNGKIANGDTLQVTLDKLYTANEQFSRNTLTTKLLAFSAVNDANVTEEDNILTALGKLQAQNNSLKAINNEQNELITGLVLRIEALEGV